MRAHLIAALWAAPAMAQSIFDIDDFPMYSSLAPCAMSAVSVAVSTLTYSKCPEDKTALQSCACTKGSNSADVLKMISSSVAYSCGRSASDDLSSAASAFNQYCNQDSPLPTPTSRNDAVSYAITDIPYFSDLAKCARSAVSQQVITMTYRLCPQGVAELNSCVCAKNDNSELVSSNIKSAVQYSCGSSASGDMSSAQALFDGWCKMADGTTSFPTLSDLSGSIRYFVTDMPDYSSLAKCAQSAVSQGIATWTYRSCLEDPGQLASCVCAKDGNSAIASRIITDSVKYSCDTTATEDISSAIAVYEQYCKAARGEVKPDGITAAVSEATTYGSKPFPAATASTDEPARTGNSNNKWGGSSNTYNNPNYTPTAGNNDANLQDTEVCANGCEEKVSHTPVIVGTVVGVVGALAIAGAGLWWWRRKKRRTAAVTESQAYAAGQNEKGAGGSGDGSAELDGAGVAAGGYKEPATGTNELHSDEFVGPTSGRVSELAGSSSTPSSELSGSSPRVPARKPVGAELAGSGALGVPENVHEAPAMGYNAGPIYEMPVHDHGR